MYGMLLESVQHFVQLEYGEDVWERILESVGYRFAVFNTHHMYPDCLMTQLAEACTQIIDDNSTKDDFMMFFGRCFIRFSSNFGYDLPIKATGRYLSDFLQNVDNIHLQMRFTYPRMKSPSMYITHLDNDGVVLVYRSSRQGFTNYFMGQLYQVAEEFYNTRVEIRILEEETSAVGAKKVMVKFRLDFDNREYMETHFQKRSHFKNLSLPTVPCCFLLELFPFGLILDENMRIIATGEKLQQVIAGPLVGQHITDNFKLRRPRGITFTLNNARYLQSVTFELEVLRIGINTREVKLDTEDDSITSVPDICISALIDRRGSQGTRSILLKGQMKYMQEINSIIFLCSPIVNNIDELPNLGLYLNDLSLHGLSREMALVGWQHCARLELMFERAEQRSIELEKSYTLLDEWKQRGDELLYSMIPRPVADRLRKGENPVNTCESFDEVTILFCELVDFNSNTVKDAMDLVTSMNAVFSCFDSLMDLYNVYKVETVGQVYMAVSGAPEYSPKHAENVVDAAIDLLYQVEKLKLPCGMKMQIRVGIHSGPVAAGVVGIKVPRYCLFGDTVNTAARMQTSSLPDRIHISATTHSLLTPGCYDIEPRGLVSVKGKGEMETYWVQEKLDKPRICSKQQELCPK